MLLVMITGVNEFTGLLQAQCQLVRHGVQAQRGQLDLPEVGLVRLAAEVVELALDARGRIVRPHQQVVRRYPGNPLADLLRVHHSSAPACPSASTRRPAITRTDS